MTQHVQAVVIGGGLIGCSILYHLAKLGWTDSLLLERDVLTSGSTWHAAAGIHGLHDNNNISRMQHYTMKLYADLEKETGQGCGVFQPGALYLAQTEEREHQLRLQEAKARLYGLNFYEVDHAEAQALHPLAQFDDVRCIMYEPDGGNVDPSGVTMAYASGARSLGASIEQHRAVTALQQQKNGGWIVQTDANEVHAEWVVNAAGLWGREVARMAGIELPLMPAEHQYLVTETIGEIDALEKRLPLIADRDGEYYMRQEGQGLLIGAYEKDMKFWAENGTPPDFGHELFPDDMDRIMENVMRACERVPVAANAGVKRIINGPMIWSPDSSALFGPVPELSNYFCCTGIIPGFSQSGGLGLLAAQWITKGEPDYDVFAWDLARFGEWADVAFTKARVQDQYSHRFAIHFPNEERGAGRPARTRPAYEFQQSMNCVFGLNCGWEHPLWFSNNKAQTETVGFKRQNWFEPVGREVNMLRSHVGVIDISNFANYIVKGENAHAWLDALLANQIPDEIGRSRLCPLIGKAGGIAGDFTVTKTGHNEFFMVGSGLAERYHQRYFQEVPMPKGVSFENATDRIAGFNIAGPNARLVLQRLSNTDFSNEAFPFSRSKTLSVAGVNCLAIRVSFTGDLGWELHCEEQHQLQLYQALIEEAGKHGGGPVGSRALGSLRIEKGYGSWGREYSTEYWPQEVGFEKLIKLDKTFLNKEAYLAVKDNKPREQLQVLEVDAIHSADATGGEPIFLGDGTPVGRVTSGAYGYSVGKSLALAFIKTGAAQPGDTLHVYILGIEHTAVLLAKPPFDANGVRLRS